MSRASLKAFGRFRDGLEAWFYLVSMMAIAFGGAFAFTEFRDQARWRKVERALSYAERFSGGDLVDARLRLDVAFLENQESLIRILEVEDAAVAYYRFILTEFSGPLTRDLELVIGFLEEFSICIDEGFCDASVARALVHPQAEAIFNTYAPYICKRRFDWKDEYAARFQAVFHDPDRSTCDEYARRLAATEVPQAPGAPGAGPPASVQ